MRNIKLTIEYDGTNYCGWQVQNSCHKKAIQEVVEVTLQKILQEKIRLIASGRTDAGVHALAQVANFKTNSRIAPEKLQLALNGLLPEDIAIAKIEEVGQDFHSRFCAKSKIYRYTILNRAYPSVFLRNRAYYCTYSLAIKLMQQEAKVMLGRHDFKSFCASGSSAKDTVRTIKRISIKRITSSLQLLALSSKEASLMTIEIEADGFLYNMVRNIVGTLIEIGRGKFPKGSLRKILLAKDRSHAGPTASACGLCLVAVKY